MGNIRIFTSNKLPLRMVRNVHLHPRQQRRRFSFFRCACSLAFPFAFPNKFRCAFSKVFPSAFPNTFRCAFSNTFPFALANTFRCAFPSAFAFALPCAICRDMSRNAR